MAFKAILVLCAQALLVKHAFGLYLNNGQSSAASAASSSASSANGLNGLNGLSGSNGASVSSSTSTSTSVSGNSAGIGYGSGIGLGQYLSNGYGNNIVGNNGLFAGSVAGLGNIAANNGGGFYVESLSPIAPTGVSLESSNAIEGALLVNANLPFLSAVALEGRLASAGRGDVAYTSGNGNIGIVSENYGSAGILANNGLGLANAGLVNAGYGNAGLGVTNAGLVNAGISNVGLLNAGISNAGLVNAGYGNAGLANIGGCGCNGLLY